MDRPSPRSDALRDRLVAFMRDHVEPAVPRHYDELAEIVAGGFPYAAAPVVERLKTLARAEGLWNLFLPGDHGAGLNNLDYAPLAEIMGRIPWSSEVFNCAAPDTGNMEVLAAYGTPDQQSRWLTPLLEGEIRSAFAMTEPGVASSDATNIETRIVRDGDDYVINGRKWWITGSMAERCRILIVMGKSDPDNPSPHRRQSMILVPTDAPGFRRIRDMQFCGTLDAPAGHGEIVFENVRVPAANLILGEGRGFEVAQGRLGPGRIHHCMRVIGMAEAALELMCRRVLGRVAFQRPLSDQGVWRERIAESRMLIEQTRLLVLRAAHRMDTVGNKVAAQEIAMIKVVAPVNCQRVIEWAMQAHGAAGFGQETMLPEYLGYAKSLRIVDGPDEVHRNAIARQELARHAGPRP
jgi:acyl-CoA dehydrogenase